MSNGKPDVPIQEHKFTITLIPVNNKPPKFLSPIPILHVSQGGSVPIGQSAVDVFDEDTALANLTVTLTRAPHNGKLEENEGSTRTVIKQGIFFSKCCLLKHFAFKMLLSVVDDVLSVFDCL